MDELLQILQQAALGSVVGYGTNWLAIRLLFQPYKRHKVVPRGFRSGVFVRHQDNLARQVAKIASDSILTVESLQEKLESQNLQDFFRGQLQDFLRTKAAEDFGPVKDQIPSDLNRDYRELVLYARGKLKDTVRDYLLSDEFGDIMRGVVYDQLDYFGRFPLSQILDEDSRGRVHEVAHTFLVSRLSNPATREEVKKFTDGMLSDFFAKDKPLAEILPQEVTENVRNRLQPLVRDSLSQIVGSVDLTPVTERIRGLMKTYVDRFFDSNTGFFDSLASKVIKGMKGDKIEQTIDEFADTFPDWLVNYLTSEEGTNQVTDYAQNAVDQMLQMSPSQIAGKLDLESMAQLRGAAADIVTTVVRSEEVASVTARYIEISLADVKDEELESILRRTKLAEPSEVYREISSFVVDKMRSDEALDRLLARASLLFRQLLEKPVGRLDRLIPQQAIVSFGNLLNQTMFDYLSYHSAELIQSLEIQETIYDKIANWEPRELHRVIMKATRENLRWLEILGGILGFIVGAISGGAVVLLS